MLSYFCSLPMRITAITLLLLILISGCVPSTPEPDAAPLGAKPAIETIEPLALDEALAPTALSIPALDLDVAVVPMGWRITDIGGQQTTVWEIPLAEAGWHVNSAGVGAAGNTILSGHQAVGDAPFAPLALGDVETGQQLFLTGEDGAVFVYTVAQVSEPVPIAGATADEQALAAAYFAATESAQLTLAIGWPDFSTTHYLFVVAEFVGRVGS